MRLRLLALCVSLTALSIPLQASPAAEDPNELVTIIEGAYSVEVGDLRVAIVRLERRIEYQHTRAGTIRPYGRRIEAGPGEEVVVIHLRTTRLKNFAVLCYSECILRAIDGTRYTVPARRCIGVTSERGIDPPDLAWEFPVVVPVGRRFDAVEFIDDTRCDPATERCHQTHVVIGLPGGM